MKQPMQIEDASDGDLRKEQLRIFRGAAAAFAVCAAVLGAAHAYLSTIVEFPGDDLASRFAFWAYTNLFIILWVLVGIHMVSHGRRKSAADIRGSAYSAPSPKIAVAVAFLQNSLEQSFVTIFSLFALIMMFGREAMPFTAASAFLFAVGRVSFLAGYPKGAGARSFGMALTALPALVAFAVVIGTLLKRCSNFLLG